MFTNNKFAVTTRSRDRGCCCSTFSRAQFNCWQTYVTKSLSYHSVAM